MNGWFIYEVQNKTPYNIIYIYSITVVVAVMLLAFGTSNGTVGLCFGSVRVFSRHVLSLLKCCGCKATGKQNKEW